ncbi:MAG: tRNA dihydrouridine synthase DusB [Candidatus Krumholzibacteria bacterium]|nr:tRNA dihydrouridine synthase DusB [Candidatus Krumholzibacteria bacterium]
MTADPPEQKHSPFTGTTVGLAPLAGWSDAPFRLLCFEYGADFAVTEMVSAEGLIRGGEKTVRLFERMPGEGPLGVQLFGSDPAAFAAAAVIVCRSDPAFIDLNFGCPVKKVIRKNGGSAIMRDLDLLGRICAAVVSVSTVPVTAKIRSGWNPEEENYIDAGRVAEEAGVAAVTLHPRYRSQLFSGEADWTHLADLREALSIDVVASGDVRGADDYRKIVEITGCETVMIGRGAFGRPWVFSEIKASLEGRLWVPPGPGEKTRTMIRLARMEEELKGERRAVVEMRKQYRWFLRGMPDVKDYRMRLSTVESMAEARLIIEELREDMEKKWTGTA